MLIAPFHTLKRFGMAGGFGFNRLRRPLRCWRIETQRKQYRNEHDWQDDQEPHQRQLAVVESVVARLISQRKGGQGEHLEASPERERTINRSPPAFEGATAHRREKLGDSVEN